MINGNYIVVGFLILLVAIGIAVAIYNPQPPSPVDVAIAKLTELHDSAGSVSRDFLQQLPRPRLDEYIDMLNYQIRLRDSLAVVTDTVSLARRRFAAQARASHLLGYTDALMLDTLYVAAHDPATSSAEWNDLCARYREQVAQ